jgi:hypothetical protein
MTCCAAGHHRNSVVVAPPAIATTAPQLAALSAIAVAALLVWTFVQRPCDFRATFVELPSNVLPASLLTSSSYPAYVTIDIIVLHPACVTVDIIAYVLPASLLTSSY